MPGPSDREWLLARERGEDVSHVPAPTRARYAELEQLITALPGQAPPPSWKRRVLDELDAAPVRPVQVLPLWRRRWVVAGGLAAAAAVVVVMLSRGRHVERPADDVVATAEIQRGGQPQRGGQVNVGDTWIVQVDAPRPIELRVYGDAGEPLALCLDGRGCTVSVDGSRHHYVLRLLLGARGDVRAVVFSGTALPPPHGLEPDLAVARQLGLEARQVAVVSVQ